MGNSLINKKSSFTLEEWKINPSNVKITFSDAYEALGSFGRYQIIILALAMLLCLYDSEMATMIFVGGNMEHWCLVDELANLTSDLQKILSVPLLDRSGNRLSPLDNGSLEQGTYSSCLRYERNYSDLIEKLESSGDMVSIFENVSDLKIVLCEKFVYSQDQFESTIVSQFDLVCGKEYLIPLVSSFYMFGGMIGCVLAGYVSDSIGRKKTLVMSLVLRVVAIGTFILAPMIHVFVLGRFIMGLAGNSVRVVHFVVVMEMFEQPYRTYVSTLMLMAISSGTIFMSIVAKFVRNHTLYQLVVFSPILLLFIYAIFLLTESPRWLHLNGKHKEINRIWSRISFFNGRKIPDHVRAENLEFPKKLDEFKSRELFSSKLLLLRILIPGYVMMSGSLIYYAVMLNINTLAGDIYTNSMISSAIEIIGHGFGIFFCNNKFTKRRLSVVGVTCITGTMQIICIPLILAGLHTVNSALMLASRATVCATTLIMTTYSNELLPVQVGSRGFGFLMMSARIGSMIAPFTGETLTKIWEPLPSALFGSISITSGVLCLLLPETYGKPTFCTIYELKMHNQQNGDIQRQKAADNSNLRY